jgi:uncharacterized small protein (DUF1192 family)
MSEDLSKLHRMRRILLDEDPTDCSLLPEFAGKDKGAIPVKTDAEGTQGKLTRGSLAPATEQNPAELLERQKQEIAELHKTISVLSSEIDLLHAALADKIDSSIAAANEEKEPAIADQQVPPVTSVNRILLMLNGSQILKYPLHKASMTVGRSSENDIQIATEFVSRVHARITSDTNGAVIEDLNSRNGVTVNSNKVSRKKLCNGDMVSLGKTQFKFIDLMEETAGEGRA